MKTATPAKRLEQCCRAVARLREKRKQEGLVEVSVWVPREAKDEIRAAAKRLLEEREGKQAVRRGN